jgi:hypothetical protein
MSDLKAHYLSLGCNVWYFPTLNKAYCIVLYCRADTFFFTPDKNDRCAFTRGSREEVMIFFEKNKVLGVEPNRVLNILEEI